MAITKAKKTEQLSALVEKLKVAQGVGFVRFDQLTVQDAQEVRKYMRERGMSYTVLKKTLMSVAAKQAGLCEFDSDELEGSVAVVVSPDDSIAPAAAIKDMMKELNKPKQDLFKLSFAGSIFEGKFLDAAQTKVLADIPTREESLGKIVGMLKSGPQKLHGVFNSGFQGLYNVMQNADKFTA